MNRKEFLLNTFGASILATWKPTSLFEESGLLAVRPNSYRLKKGDRIAVISPAGGVDDESQIDEALAQIRSLGFEAVPGKSLGKKWGYLGGRDGERVKDLHEAFGNDRIKAIMALRGGYGASRLLPLIDFQLIKEHPKPFIGYSDITALLIAISQQCDMVTLHGPNALTDWSDYTISSFKQILGAKVGTELKNHPSDNLETLVPGDCSGRITGGNLTLITQLMGTPWEIETKDRILFFEETNESAYRIDRMLTQLWLSRKLQEAKGFIIGQITGAGNSAQELNWQNVVRDRLIPLGKPTLMNLSAGHVSQMMTLPIGAKVYLNASGRQIILQENI